MQNVKVSWMRTKTKITPSLLADAKALAGKGYPITIIADSLSVGYSTCRNNVALKAAIKEGQAKARQDVVDHLMERSLSDQSATSSIYLSKVMRVFNDVFPTSSPNSPSDALKKISDIYTAVARNELSEERGNHLVGYLEKYVKTFEVSDLEERISRLEALNEK